GIFGSTPCTICLPRCRAMAAVSSGVAGLAMAIAAAVGSIPHPPLVDTRCAPYIRSMHPRRLGPCLLLLAGLAVAPAAERATAAEVGGRVVVAPETGPWKAIGRLNVAGFRIRRHCTATLVA